MKNHHLVKESQPVTDSNIQYLEHFPDAVSDTDKAHDMASAGDWNRTKAARYRRVGKFLESYVEAHPEGPDAKRVHDIAERAGRAIARKYSDDQDVSRSEIEKAYDLTTADLLLSENHGFFDKTIEFIDKSNKYFDEQADKSEDKLA